MIRRIIHIDEEKCNGCGLCAEACHEGAIGMSGGKAKLLRDDYCDGLGDCLPACPAGAITFVEREAAAYDEAAVKARMAAKAVEKALSGGCPGAASKDLRPGAGCPGAASHTPQRHDQSDNVPTDTLCSRLANWPVQIRLAPLRAGYFDGADLLIAADCTAYAYAGFHDTFMRNRVTLIGCPKLDGVDYSEKLTEILRDNDIASVTVLRMEVPCCGGLQMAAEKAVRASGKLLPVQVVTISTDGGIL